MNATAPLLFLIFVQTFVPHICHNNSNPNCNPQPHNFTIHGLWPEYNNNTYPSFCNNTKFNPDAIEDLVPLLNTNWPSYEGTNMNFWEHEFHKHATCDPNVTEHNYFQNALNAFGTANSNNLWKKGGFERNINYPNGLVTSWFDAHPSCHDGKVVELWRCHDLNMTLISCPKWISSKCPNNVIF